MRSPRTPRSSAGSVVARRYGSAAGIERIVTGDHVEHQRIVGTVRVKGPTWSSVNESGNTPRRDTRP